MVDGLFPMVALKAKRHPRLDAVPTASVL